MRTSNVGEAGLLIGAGFAEIDQQRIAATLENLLPYLNKSSFCISGGLATAAQLSRANALTEPRAFNDIDIVIPSISALVPQGLSSSFSITEVELNDPVDDVYVRLVDKSTDVKVDLFGWGRFPPETEDAMLGEQLVPIRTTANLGALLLCAIDRRIREDLPKIAKQFTDLSALMELTTMEDIGRNWQRFPQRTIGGPHEENTHYRARHRIRTFLEANPEFDPAANS